MYKKTTNIGLLLGLGIAATTHAAPMLEEVIVTAQKKSESLQDTPISLMAFNNRQLEKFGISDLSDIESSVPNLQLTAHPNSGSTPRIFIRGVGNFDDQITQDPSVAVYIDGAYVARNQGMGIEVADIERIEILRGPQGTLYGRNATGGAINFVTQAPELGAWGFSQSLTYGRFEEFRSRTMLNVPLGDQAAARIAYLKSSKHGYVDNIGTGESRFGDLDRQAARLDLLWQPSASLSLRYTYDQSELEDTPFYLHPEAVGSRPDRPTRSSSPANGLEANDTETGGHQLTVSWDLTDSLTFKSISGYRDLDSETYQDYLGGLLVSQVSIDQEQWSQEFQFLGNAFDGQLDYIAGVYYFREEGSGLINNLVPGFGVRTFSDTDIENTAYAIFAQATYSPEVFDSRLHVTLGGRYSKDERQADIVNSTLILASNTLLPGYTGNGDDDFSNFSPSLTVSYDLTDSANVYAKVADGYKTGGFNVRATTKERFDNGFDEETLRSYEVGLKSQWLDNRLRLNAAVFLADYEDIQVNAQSDLSDATKADIINAGEAEIEGVELDITALLTDRITLGLNYGYLNADYEQIDDFFGRDVTDDFIFVNAPQHSYVIDLDYDIAELPFGNLALNVNYSWQDEKYSTVSTTNGEFVIDDYGLLNARLALSEIPVGRTGHLRVALWGRNLEDEEYPTLYAPLFGGYRSYGDPRSYGVDAVYEF